VFVKSYGAPGNLTSLSFRGTLSNHTQITWNGFPLNNPTTGDADLSLIPLTIADKVSLVYGASGSLYGGGTFGGSVDLISSPSSEQGFSSGLSSKLDHSVHGLLQET
jgi:iron complex outermembrane receptor protein